MTAIFFVGLYILISLSFLAWLKTIKVREYFVIVRFQLFFSLIFDYCLWLLEAKSSDPTETLLLDPAGKLMSPRLRFLYPVRESWLRFWS